MSSPELHSDSNGHNHEVPSATTPVTSPVTATASVNVTTHVTGIGTAKTEKVKEIHLGSTNVHGNGNGNGTVGPSPDSGFLQSQTPPQLHTFASPNANIRSSSISRQVSAASVARASVRSSKRRLLPYFTTTLSPNEDATEISGDGDKDELIPHKHCRVIEELDLNEQVSELKDQNLKQGDDIRVTVQKLNEAEDRNYDLEGKITKLQLQLDLTLKQLSKVKKDHQTEIQGANEVLDETKDKLRDSTTRIHKLEKSCQQFEAERDALKEEVTKSSSEVQWFYHKNNELKASLKKSQDVFEKQLKEYVEGSMKLEEQNGQLLTEINNLRSSKFELEKENSELLEILENCQYRKSGSQHLSSNSHSNAHSSSFEELEDFEFGDSFDAYGDSALPIPNLPPQSVSQPNSIFHELQNAMVMFQNVEMLPTSPCPFKLSSTDASTQTQESPSKKKFRIDERKRSSKLSIGIIPEDKNKERMERFRRIFWPHGFISWMFIVVGLICVIGLDARHTCDGIWDVDSVLQFSHTRQPRI